MNKLNKILIAILAVQGALIGITWTMCQSDPERIESSPLFDFEPKDVTALSIIGTQGSGQNPEIVLNKSEGGWVLASADSYPAKTDAVEKIITSLTDIHVANPIANNPTNHPTLNVGANGFDRKVTLTENGKTHTVYIGRGSRSATNVRLDGNNQVYQAKNLSVWSISANPNGYVDTVYLDTPAEGITAFSVTNPKGTLSFTKEGADWTTSELPEGETLASKKVEDFVKKIAKLTLSTPVGKSDKPEYGLGNGTKVTIKGTKENKPFSHSYVLGAKAENNRYAKLDNNDYIVAVSNYSVEPITEKVLADFFKTPEDNAPAPSPQGMPGGLPPELQGLQGLPPGVMMPQGQ